MNICKKTFCAMVHGLRRHQRKKYQVSIYGQILTSTWVNAEMSVINLV